MIKKFEGLEVLALLVACLCHDLDHRGTNNAFQVKQVSTLNKTVYKRRNHRLKLNSFNEI